MSITVFQPHQARPATASGTSSTRSTAASAVTLSVPAAPPSIPEQYNPFGDRKTQDRSRESNPVADLIPDEVYLLLRSNDMINEKAVRDYVIRRAFYQLREQQHIKTADAIEKIKEVYPYLQIDTIRKIIYRISPVGRKAMAV